MVAERPENRIFGKRAQQHVVILASGDRIRHMTIRPWMAAVTFCFAGMFTVGYLAATSYLVLRDDLIGATMARQARMQHDYEDRISALRAQVDRVTSRQLLDQQVVEEKVEKLMQQQLALSTRHGKLDALLNRTDNAGTAATDTAPLTGETPVVDGRRADAAGAVNAVMGMTGASQKTTQLAYAATGESVADRADRLFSKVTLSLKDLEHDQISRIQSLTTGASQTADAIQTIVRRTGLDVTEEATGGDSETAIGGPFVEPVDVTDPFEASINDLDTALDRLDTARRSVRKLPFGNPSPASSITSRFGNRTDPFLGRLALHAGIDFRAGTGTEIGATGAGTVVVAGRNGGYGNMVEIDHGNGLKTRYAHLSRVLVKIGDHVEASAPIGLSGSTGRSTGPHLHYEVRRDGKALDPMRFLTAGMKLTTYMD
ncbi:MULTISPECIES: peptidoglycan DD-metalloendopeptidase family protein [unclassified Shinella]|uniref:peptidoglycan DD-metalloendopeptidase family protein n=1 Tax=unclassified Shinella TaxID=2643062 RepID=UPI00234E5B39|nr:MULTISPECIES: peptidoglycan DD-metalloendopeptidase family protein [unclassified Shinella]MCO5150023.1 peptidoglycan DD-metalloendopeptidase family protein [Shinella sp.]MDC7262069.1 peptidoglycan DD-metalloendopeptidase family protein [Shinella sp. HY16]MDC7268964.1 peptidoglycan DD-metalloendopeptidase family protein [Shinella sp. YZ44]